MKKLMVMLIAAALSLSAAADITFKPSGSGLMDLDHSYAYAWKINTTGYDLSKVTGAQVVFKSIYDWNGGNENDVLYIQMLDTYNTGTKDVRKVYDGQNNGNYFKGKGVSVATLTVSEDIPLGYKNRKDVFVDLSTSLVETLKSYALNGNNVCIAFDPDCHFYDCGVELRLTETVPPPPTVPAPAAMLLAGIGTLTAGWLRRNRRL